MYFLAINYHYIGSFNTPFEGIYPVTGDNFKNQLSLLASSFDFVSQQDILSALKENTSLPERSCIITFDDGLRSQYEIAVPILRELNIPAIFFISGKPINEKKVLSVHKGHWLRSNIPPEEMLDKVISLAQISNDSLEKYEEKATASYRYDKKDSAIFKYILNYLLTPEQKEKIIDSMFADICDDEKNFSEKWYMSPENISELSHEEQFGIGGHGYGHHPLATLTEDEVRNEIHLTNSLLHEITGDKIQVMSYPHGGESAVSIKESEIAGNLGILFSFTMERAFNRTLSYPLLLSRIDVNDAPGGKKPMFEISGNEIKSCDKDFDLSRTRYFNENNS